MSDSKDQDLKNLPFEKENPDLITVFVCFLRSGLRFTRYDTNNVGLAFIDEIKKHNPNFKPTKVQQRERDKIYVVNAYPKEFEQLIMSLIEEYRKKNNLEYRLKKSGGPRGRGGFNRGGGGRPGGYNQNRDQRGGGYGQNRDQRGGGYGQRRDQGGGYNQNRDQRGGYGQNRDQRSGGGYGQRRDQGSGGYGGGQYRDQRGGGGNYNQPRRDNQGGYGQRRDGDRDGSYRPRRNYDDQKGGGYNSGRGYGNDNRGQSEGGYRPRRTPDQNYTRERFTPNSPPNSGENEGDKTKKPRKDSEE